MAPNTYFLDIDGTLLRQVETIEEMSTSERIEALPNVPEKVLEWHKNGCRIILTTARPENLRDITTIQLRNAGIVYDQLIMGVGNGVRVVVNDYSTDRKTKACDVLRNVDGLTFID